MAIQFNTIPIDLRSSGQYVEYNNSRAGQRLAGIPSRILLIGQKIAAGTVAPLTPTRFVTADDVAALAGLGSQLWAMADCLRAVNKWTEAWLIALPDDAAAQAASGSLTFTAAAGASGTLTLRIDGTRVRVGIGAGDTVGAMATALAAAINAERSLPVTATAGAGSVTWGARWKGESGNAIDARVGYYDEEAPPPGLSFTLAAMSGGSANPDVGDALATVAGTWFTDIVCPYTDTANLVQLEEDGARRWGGMVMTDAHYYVGRHGTYGALATFGNGRNSPNLTYVGGHNSPSSPWRWAAALAGICAYESKQDPARPYQTLALPRSRILPPPMADRFDLTVRELLLRDGISTWWVDDDGTVRLDNIITSYQRNGAGYEDSSYRQLETVKTLSFLRYSMRARIAQRFPRHKAAGDSYVKRPGQFVARPQDIRDELIALAYDWQDAGLVEGIDQFKAELAVERDDNDPNRFNAIIPPDLVNQFRVFAARIDFTN